MSGKDIGLQRRAPDSHLIREECLKRIRKAERREHYQDALRWCKETLRRYGDQEGTLEAKIRHLQHKMDIDSAKREIREAETKRDFLEVVKACDRCLSYEELALDRETVAGRKAIALVRLKRFDEAIATFKGIQRPLTDRERYAFGFSTAWLGRYLEAARVWELLDDKGGQEFQDQRDCVVRAALAEAISGKDPLQDLKFLEKHAPEHPALSRIRWLCLHSLWQTEQYENVLPLLPPLGPRTSLSEILFRAKALFWLAQKSSRHLDELIPIWLTAIFNLAPSGLPEEELKVALLRALDPIFHAYECEHGVLKCEKLRRRLTLERDITEKIRPALGDGKQQVLFTDQRILLCAPSLAHDLGCGSQTLAILDSKKKRKKELDHIRPYFSACGKALVLAESGYVDQSLSALPESDTRDLLWRQRVHFFCGIAKVLEGDSHGIRHLFQALPLVCKDPAVRKKLVALAYSASGERAAVALSDPIATMAEKASEGQLAQAAAHLLYVAGKKLFEEEKSKDIVCLRYLERAAKLCPSDKAISGLKNEIRKSISMDEMGEAFSRAKFAKAAAIARQAQDKETEANFFHLVAEAVEKFNDELPLEVSFEFMPKLLLASESVNASHPLVRHLKRKLFSWGKL